jgi:uncharacterized protein
MAEHPNATRAREAMETFGRGDLHGYRDFFTEDVLWHVGGEHPLSGDYRGREALFGYFARVGELTGATLRIDPLDVLADDTHCAIFTRVTAQREGKEMDVVLAQAFKVNAEGRWTEYWALADDQEALERFWS